MTTPVSAIEQQPTSCSPCSLKCGLTVVALGAFTAGIAYVVSRRMVAKPIQGELVVKNCSTQALQAASSQGIQKGIQIGASEAVKQAATDYMVNDLFVGMTKNRLGVRNLAPVEASNWSLEQWTDWLNQELGAGRLPYPEQWAYLTQDPRFFMVDYAKHMVNEYHELEGILASHLSARSVAEAVLKESGLSTAQIRKLCTEMWSQHPIGAGSDVLFPWHHPIS